MYLSTSVYKIIFFCKHCQDTSNNEFIWYIIAQTLMGITYHAKKRLDLSSETLVL